MKKAVMFVTALALSSAMVTSVFASTQVFVDGNRITNVIEEDGKTYVQLRELSHYIGYELEYNAQAEVVNAYKIFGEAPEVKREQTLFPVNVEELDFGDRKEIVKVYELESNESPFEISKESFEKNGYAYEFTDMIRSSNDYTDQREHVEVVEVETSSNDMNTVLKELKEEIEFASEDGYTGTLKLDISTVNSAIQGYNNSSYTVKEVREYPNLSSPDTSLVPKTIQANGKTLNLANVSWKSANTETIDYSQLADNYTAVATYSGTGTKSSVKGYTTTAEYKGTLTKYVSGKAVYTAYFTGTKVNVSPEDIKQQLKEAKEQEIAERKANGELVINPGAVAMPLLVILAIGGVIYLVMFKRNVKVYCLDDGLYKKIGKVRLTKKVGIVDLSPFTGKATTPSFKLTMNGLTAKRFDDETLTINYGDNSFQHIVTVNDGGSIKEEYAINVDF